MARADHFCGGPAASARLLRRPGKRDAAVFPPGKARMARRMDDLSLGGICQFKLFALRRFQPAGALPGAVAARFAALRYKILPLAARFRRALSGGIAAEVSGPEACPRQNWLAGMPPWVGRWFRFGPPGFGFARLPFGKSARDTACRPRLALRSPGDQNGAVPDDDLSDAALVLVGHGSTLNAESSAPTYQHADELRRRKIFAQVVECFWKLEPSICAVLRGVFAPRVFVVPLFISDGYFTEEVIPRELGLCAKDQKH